jgi:hypothetical protein
MFVCSSFVVLFFLVKNAPLVIENAWDSNKKKFFLIRLLMVVLQILQDIEILYYLAYGVLAVLGTFVHPFFFCFHLSEILLRFPTLKSVVRAVYEPGE